MASSSSLDDETHTPRSLVSRVAHEADKSGSRATGGAGGMVFSDGDGKSIGTGTGTVDDEPNEE
jgi:hypothetical protein